MLVLGVVCDDLCYECINPYKTQKLYKVSPLTHGHLSYTFFEQPQRA